MYKQFCRNLNYFISIMRSDDNVRNTRIKNAEALLPLLDIEIYRVYKNCGKEEYEIITNLIYDISRYSEEYPSLKKFVWELWAYGFDIEQARGPVVKNYEEEEVAKIADLMLSTHYFPTIGSRYEI